MTPRSISIYGPGLLGGSLVMALRQAYPSCVLRVWGRRQEALALVRAEPAVAEASTDAAAIAADADCIILATPVEHMHQQVQDMLPALRPGTVVTDVGSVKGGLVQRLEQLLAPSGAFFVGSHPMAGKEKAGWEHRDAGIFPGATCILTPTALTQTQALQQVVALWQQLGMRVLQMSTAEHDRRIARVSHMPHVVSAALAYAALKDDAIAGQCGGGGFRDMVRIARGHDGLWTGILTENQAEVVAAVEDVRDRLTELVAILQRMDKEALRQYLTDAADLLKEVPAGPLRHHGPA
jgi:prephenate dehydrogenase